MKSGECLVITVPDPVRLPLPDTRIQEIQWLLQRFAALSGAAESELDSDNNDDDKGIDDFGLQLLSALQSSSMVLETRDGVDSQV
ncbi:hypothetical protein ASPTUDRAFT_187571 [Aspergillus tubingensis CBS 134.48]|uniref:Uncharacterized protein n=1 Tax=Aspergillus tubingensis (strain CBS 134.48) TaxID=767770 RepID=A0A1L9NAL0_ASPTC|nr:hypothetical protein ASPTUDRAFT_187571 [Aspergillus tubingensis CBS 134.48]